MIDITKQEFDYFLLKLKEISESNVLVAATNIANDEGIAIEVAVEKALDLMDLIRETKRDRRFKAVV